MQIGNAAEMNPPRRVYGAMFFISLSTLMLEILLTRIFSVTMWYHFAFMAVSIAMFGMTAGALVVFLRPRWFDSGRLSRSCAIAVLAFSVTTIAAFLLHARLRFDAQDSWRNSVKLALTYVAFAVPFAMSGIAISALLTRLPARVNQLYAADLFGAAAGCLGVVVVLRFTDGPNSIFVTAALGCVGVALLLTARSPVFLRISTFGLLAAVAGFAMVNAWFVHHQQPLVRLTWVKGEKEGALLYEKWNSYSRIAVMGNPDVPGKPSAWGFSPTIPKDQSVRQLGINIDASALTMMTEYHGNPADVWVPRYSIVQLVQFLRTGGDEFIIGAGGGTDILAALGFGQRHIDALEMNSDIIRAVNGKFGEFSGHLDRDPRVSFINDEARSYISRSGNSYDIIASSMIDTWAATAAGAFVLAENSLYTREAWQIFFRHLTSRGIMTFSRWYYVENPAEVYRLVALANAALRAEKIVNPAQHIALARILKSRRGEDRKLGIGTILVSREPFTPQDLDTLTSVCTAMQYELALSPRGAVDPMLSKIAAADEGEARAIAKAFPVRIDAPTDDNPFFFHMLRFRDVLKTRLFDVGFTLFNMKAVSILLTLLLVVTVLTLLCIFLPLLVAMRQPRAGDSKFERRPVALLVGYFCAIGLGFMFVEISQMQRLMIFLGHPNYALTIVLFSLLISSGAGSWASGAVGRSGLRGHWWVLAVAVAVLALTGAFTPALLSIFGSQTTTLRILVSGLLIAPAGFFMGMAFPIGLRIAAQQMSTLTPWLWGVNGAASVWASVLAIAVALGMGISASFWIGVACYVAAAACVGALAPQIEATSPIAAP